MEQLSYSDILPGADGEFVKYAEKIDNFLEETLDKADKLHEEGVALMKPDVLGLGAKRDRVGERNAHISARVGVIKALRTNLIAMYEKLRREV